MTILERALGNDLSVNRKSEPRHIVESSGDSFPSDAYIRYLAAKRSVDDRALNRYVWQTLKTALPPSTEHKPLKVIDLGAGIGAMFDRVMEWGLAPHLRYTLVELSPDYLAAFRERGGPDHPNEKCASQVLAEGNAVSVMDCGGCTVDTICADLYDVISDQRQEGEWDLVIAHAVMDLVNMAEVLPRLARIAKPGGLLYLSLIYDGYSEFVPSEDLEFERLLFDRYHRSMDTRHVGGRPSGNSRAARDMFVWLEALDLPLLAAGSSDWIVHPREGIYLADEAFFLDMIIETIDRQLRQDITVDPSRLEAWAARMHARVKSGGLTFMARNIDFLAQRPHPSPPQSLKNPGGLGL